MTENKDTGNTADDSIEMRSPAKLNLFLYVTGKRGNGFHELYSLMVPVSLCDRVVLEFGSSGKPGVSVVCAHPDVPENDTNLACRAAHHFMRACDRRGVKFGFGSLVISIDKQIPVGGGLGGGSSNAAAVLNGLNLAAGKPFSRAVLEQIGLGLGADVPFFIRAIPAFARGIGDQLSPCQVFYPVWGVIVSPDVAASTAAVFKKLDFGLTFNPVCIMNTGSNALPFGKAGVDGCEELHNDLERPACKLYPEIDSTKQEMMLLLQRKVYMSGSGSSLFALYADRAAAKAGMAMLNRAWPRTRRRIFLVQVGQI